MNEYYFSWEHVMCVNEDKFVYMHTYINTYVRTYVWTYIIHTLLSAFYKMHKHLNKET